jgi:predicted RNA-binding Zn ribbon-like protein
MAAIERPSVMRVAAIHNEATDTFIVFEHLIPLPVVLTGLTAVAKDAKPATKAAEDKDRTVVLGAVVGPVRSAAAPPVAAPELSTPTIVELDEPEPPKRAANAQRPQALLTASRSLSAARSDLSALLPWATRLIADLRTFFRDVRLDELLAEARARLRRIDTSLVRSLGARVTTRMRELASAASTARPSMSATDKAAPATERQATAGALPMIASLAMSAAASAAPLLARARGNRLALGAGALVLVAVVVVVSPLDDAIGGALASRPGASPSVAPSDGLARAPFEVPPLAAYGAAFESQGAYPKTTPNGTVEWVVALLNTGSAGWYRGIEGAQAALALADGTGVAVQSTPYVGPGQVGWFVVHFRARPEPGTYTVQLLPRIDGRGPLADLGVFAVVTVVKNP